MSTSIADRVEEFRIKLGLEPWDQFRAKQLARWDADTSLAYDMVQQMKAEERQCGRSTRELLYAIAEADLLGWDLLPISYGKSNVMHSYARDLVDRLGLENMNVRLSVAFQKEIIVYVDHLVGRAAKISAG